MPPQLTTSLDLHAVFLEAVDDRQGAEGGRLDQRPVDLRRGGVQRLADQQAGQQRIDQDRAVAVVPVQGQQPAFAGPEPFGGLAGQIAVRVAVGRVWAAGARYLTNQLKMSPTADWPASRPYMPGMIEPGTMPHRPGMSGNVVGQRGDHHVAGAGADDLHQRAGLDAGPHRAHVGVEGADGHRHARRQADLAGHLGRQPAGLLVGRQGRLA